MNLETLKVYYNKIDSCSILIKRDVDFEYIQTQISKMAIYTEELNRIIGDILVDKTRLEHLITDKNFEYELRFTQYLSENLDVKKFTTGKERKDYINYYLLRPEYRELVSLEQENRDMASLLDLAKKKARDLDKAYPKLKTLWESVQSEMKYIKKIGSDSEYLERVKEKMSEGKEITPVFTDTLVEQIKNDQYNYEVNVNGNVGIVEEELVTDKNNITENVDDLFFDF